MSGLSCPGLWRAAQEVVHQAAFLRRAFSQGWAAGCRQARDRMTSGTKPVPRRRSAFQARVWPCMQARPSHYQQHLSHTATPSPTLWPCCCESLKQRLGLSKPPRQSCVPGGPRLRSNTGIDDHTAPPLHYYNTHGPCCADWKWCGR
jgi:hypothetical protein